MKVWYCVQWRKFIEDKWSMWDVYDDDKHDNIRDARIELLNMEHKHGSMYYGIKRQYRIVRCSVVK